MKVEAFSFQRWGVGGFEGSGLRVMVVFKVQFRADMIALPTLTPRF